MNSDYAYASRDTDERSDYAYANLKRLKRTGSSLTRKIQEEKRILLIMRGTEEKNE